MALSDPLGRHADPYPQRSARDKGAFARDRPRSSARTARGAAARGLHPRLTRLDEDGGKSELSIELKYHNGEPVIRELRRVSKPGRRVCRAQGLPRLYNGLGIAILSTPRGVVSDTEARECRSAAKSFARCSDHVAHRQHPWRSGGVHGWPRRPDGARVRGKLGELGRSLPPEMTSR